MREASFGWSVDESWILPAQSKPINMVKGPRARRRKSYLSAEEATNLLASNVAAAEARARKFLEAAPDDPDALYLLGAALRRTGRHAEARAILEPLTVSQPQMGRTWYELGEALAALAETEKAENALRRAVDLDWLNTEAWYALGDVPTYRTQGRDGTPPDSLIEKAQAAIRERRFEFAESILRSRLVAQPADTRAMKQLADLLLQTGRWSEFESLLERCLTVDPAFVPARFRYATMLFTHGHFDRAVAHIEQLLKPDPGSLLYRSLRALAISWSRQFESGIAAFEEFIDACDRPGIWLEYARMLRATRNPKAAAAHQHAIRMLPSLFDAYLSLANIKSFVLDEELILQIQTQLSRPHLPAEDRAKLHFVLGKAFDDQGSYAEAFDNYRVSNEILRGAGESGIEESKNYLQNAKIFFTPPFFRRRAGVGCPEKGPIFIVGMPRSGSTLVEQILSCHSAVEALGELNALVETGSRLAPERSHEPQGTYPYLLNNLDTDRFRLIGEEYLKAIRSRRRLDKPFFTDKLPGNFRHIGLIALALPNARIIDTRRHPLACCFSCYKHDFLANMPFALDQRDIARFYVNYVDLMAHFDEVLPGKIHRLFYEDLIDNFETEVRRLLDYLELPFEEECLRFHESRRVVLTLSGDQVGRPLYRSGMEDWRHFEQWLGPMKEELGYVLDKYPEVPKFYAGVHTRSKSPLSLGEAGRRFAFVKGLHRVPFEIASHTRATFAPLEQGGG